MNTLFARLAASGGAGRVTFRPYTEPIDTDLFCAALAELDRGKITRAELTNILGIAPDEEADMDLVIARLNAAAPPGSAARALFLEEVRQVLRLVGLKYRSVAALRARLGI